MAEFALQRNERSGISFIDVCQWTVPPSSLLALASLIFGENKTYPVFSEQKGLDPLLISGYTTNTVNFLRRLNMQG
eukprot:gene4266-6590_t